LVKKPIITGQKRGMGQGGGERGGTLLTKERRLNYGKKRWGGGL